MTWPYADRWAPFSTGEIAALVDALESTLERHPNMPTASRIPALNEELGAVWRQRQIKDAEHLMSSSPAVVETP